MADAWFRQIENSLIRFKNLQIIYLNIQGDIELLTNRSINIQCNILDNELTLIDENNSIIITQEIYK